MNVEALSGLLVNESGPEKKIKYLIDSFVLYDRSNWSSLVEAMIELEDKSEPTSLTLVISTTKKIIHCHLQDVLTVSHA